MLPIPPKPSLWQKVSGVVKLKVAAAIDFAAISNPPSPAAGYARFHAATTQGFTRFEQDNEAATNLVLGRDNVFIAKNTSAGTISKGQPVYVTGATGNVPNIGLAKADSLTTLPAIGVALDNINTNNFGQVMKLGVVSNIDTSAYSTGDVVWVSATSAGALTNTRPVSPSFVQRIGSVLVSGVGNGSLLITTAPFVGGMESGTNSNFTMNGNTLSGSTASGGNLTLGSTSHATKGKVLVGTSGYDEVNNRLGVNNNAPESLIHVDGLDDTSTNADFRLRKYSSVGGVAAFYGERAGGSKTSPTATPSGKAMFFLGARGYGTAWSSALTAVIQAVSEELFNDSSQATYLSFATTPTGTTSRAERFRIAGDGEFMVKMHDNASVQVAPTDFLYNFLHNKSVVDDAYITLPAVTTNGYGIVICGTTPAEFTQFYCGSTGVVTLLNNTANVVANADTDTKLCIGTANPQEPLLIKNRLGATHTINVMFWHD